jgi:flap endonuclease GEN
MTWKVNMFSVFLVCHYRLKQWRGNPRYEHLEVEYLTLRNTCSICAHTGKLQKHAKSGCEVCGTKYGCIQTTDMNHLSQKNV